MDDSYLLAVGTVYAENPSSATGRSQVKKPGLSREPWRVGQEPNREGILERFFDFLQSQRAIEIEGWIGPIKLHSSSIVINSPMQCRYIVFTHEAKRCQLDIFGEITKTFN